MRESCKGQLAVSEVPTHWGCVTTARGLLQWHCTRGTWERGQGTHTAPGSTSGDLPSRGKSEAPREHHLDHTVSLTGTRHFPVCFAQESFLMLGDPVGLQEEMKMLRESRVCNSPASSLFGHAKQLRRGALLRQWLCTSRRRDGLKPAGKRRQPSRQPKRGEREEGVRAYGPSQAFHPQLGSPRVRGIGTYNNVSALPERPFMHAK